MKFVRWGNSKVIGKSVALCGLLIYNALICGVIIFLQQGLYAMQVREYYGRILQILKSYSTILNRKSKFVKGG